MLAVATDHVTRASSLGRAAYQFAVHLHTRYRATELLPFDFALSIGIPIAHDGWRSHDGKCLPADPERIHLWCAPALHVRRHVLDHGAEGFNSLKALRGRHAGPHVCIEEEPTKVGRKMPVGEVHAAVPQGAIQIIIKRFAPPRLALLGVEELGQLLPLRQCVRTPQLPAIPGLKFFPGPWQLY